MNAPHLDANGDWVCEHGTAMDVHCCNCHSGFLFDSDSCVCEFDKPETVEAVDPHVRSEGKLSTRDSKSSEFTDLGLTEKGRQP